MPDIYLRAVPSDANTADVRLYDPTLFPGVITGSLAWTSGNDTWAVSSVVLVSGTIAVQSGSDTWSLASNVRVSGTIAVQSGSDTWSLTSSLTVSGAVSFAGQNDTWALTSSVTGGNVSSTLAWTSGSDTWAASGAVQQDQQRGGVGPAWDNTRGLTPELRAKIRKQLEEEIAEPVREAIAAQSKTRFESMEAEERAIRAATEAAQIEYQALYLRLLAYQREEMLMEEEAIVMTMFAALSR